MDKKKLMIVITVCIIVLLLLGTSLAIVLSRKNKVTDVLGVSDFSGEFSGDLSGDLSGEESGEIIEKEIYTGPKIFSGDARPVAVMIDNEMGAWKDSGNNKPHAGLNDAYMIYEIIVEGGETRFIAFFKGANPEKLGPVRSTRHYFLDYVMEHDALYTHFGWSPLAQSDIKRLGINNINGIYDTFFWREPPKYSYHNAFTSMERIMTAMTRKGYRLTSDKECIIKYNEKDTDLNTEMIANSVNLKYSNLQNPSYVYDKDRKVYLRSKNGVEHRDRWTNEQFYAKNIIIIKVRNALLDDPEDKGRQELYNVGNGVGYYITNGEYEPITWKKDSRSSRTVYYDQEGEEIKVNDGITWVQIMPMNASITIE